MHHVGHRRQPAPGNRIRDGTTLLREDGARVFAHSFAPHDATEPWGADLDGVAGALDGLVVNHARSQLGVLREYARYGADVVTAARNTLDELRMGE